MNKKFILIGAIVVFLMLILLTLGNVNYNLKQKITGRVIDDVEINSEDLNVAEQIEDGSFESNVDIRDISDVNNDVNSRLMEFEVPEGKIVLEFDLLDYGNWEEADQEREVKIEEFDVEVQESSEKYKWGYDVKLNSLEFMARIDVSVEGNSSIDIVDNKTLKIGNNYLSFNDLIEEGYSVVIEEPILLEEINLTVVNETEVDINITDVNITDVNQTEINITEINETGGDINITIPDTNITINDSEEIIVEINETEEEQEGSEDEIIVETNETEAVDDITEETVEEEIVEEEVNGEEEIIDEDSEAEEIEAEEEEVIEESNEETGEVGITANVIRGISGFVIRGFQGITGNVISEEDKISIYVQKDFRNNSDNVSVGDVINLDPELFTIASAGDNGTATDGNIVYQCGTINQSGSFTLNQSISGTGSCLTLEVNDTLINCNDNSITYGVDAGSSGIKATSVLDNVTIFNCNINLSASAGANTSRIGINLSLTNGNFTDLNIYGGNQGIYLLNTDSLVVRGVNFSEGVYGIDFACLNNSNFNILNINAGTTPIKSSSCSSSNHNVFNNLILSSGTRAFDLTYSGTNNTITNLNTSNSGDVYVQDCTNCVFGDFILNNIQASKFALDVKDSFYANIYNISFYTSGHFARLNNADHARVDNLTNLADNYEILYLSGLNNASVNEFNAGIDASNIYNSSFSNISVPYYGSDPTGSNYEIYFSTAADVNLSNINLNPAVYHTSLVIYFGSDINIDNANIDYLAFAGGNYFSVSNVNISNLSSQYGIMSPPANSNYTNITIWDTRGGILSFASTSNNYNNLKILNSLSAYPGIIFSSGSDNNFTNLFINNTGDGLDLTNFNGNNFNSVSMHGNSLFALECDNCDNNILSNLEFGNNTLSSIYLGTASGNNTFTNFNLSDSNNGIELREGSHYNNFSNFKIENDVLNGISLATGANNYNNFEQFVIDPYNFSIGSNIAIDLMTDQDHNVFKECNITHDDSRIHSYGSINNSFINCTYDAGIERTGAAGIIYKKWYYQAHVTDNSSTDVPNASVVAYNITGSPTLNLTTNASGWTPIGHAIDYAVSNDLISYYSNYIFAANANISLWDSHNYNLTQVQNSFNDTFIVEEDYTAPVFSGASWTSNTTSVTINWNTDEGSNSSITYWASPSVTVGENLYVIAHSFTINNLTTGQTYNYYYSGCDFAGNCGSSANSTFTIATPSQGTISGESEGGSSCVSNYKCGLCQGNLGEEGIRYCGDDNNCPLSEDYSEVCIVSGEDLDSEDIGIELPGDVNLDSCISNWDCSEWNDCMAVYDLEDIIGEKVLLDGEQQRKCVDKNHCEYDKVERQECVTKMSVYAKKVFRCNDNYLEIYDSNDILISRMKLVDGVYQKLNVQMLFDEFGYCPYCYDGQKNYGEDEVDCQYSGEDCPKCSLETPFLRQNYSFMLITLIGLTFLSFLFIIWYLVLMRKRRRKVRKITHISHINHRNKSIRKNHFKFNKKIIKKILIVGFLVAGLVGLYFLFSFVFKLISLEGLMLGLNKIKANLSFVKDLDGILVPIGLIVGVLIILFFIKKIVKEIKISKLLRIEKEVLGKFISKTEHKFEDVKKESKKFGKRIHINSKKQVRSLKKISKKYNHVKKGIIRSNKKLVKKRDKILKQEKKKLRPMVKKRKRFLRDSHNYKQKVQELKGLRARVSALDDFYGETNESRNLKQMIHKDIAEKT